MLDAETKDRLNRGLTWFLAAALVAAVIGVIYIAVNPVETADPFTEFYILGPEGEASDYPTQLGPGETGTVIVGITNNEHEDLTYRVEIRWNDTTTYEREIPVADEETREFEVTVTAPAEPSRYRLRFLLYRTDIGFTEPYRTLRLWVTVEA